MIEIQLIFILILYAASLLNSHITSCSFHVDSLGFYIIMPSSKKDSFMFPFKSVCFYVFSSWERIGLVLRRVWNVWVKGETSNFGFYLLGLGDRARISVISGQHLCGLNSLLVPRERVCVPCYGLLWCGTKRGSRRGRAWKLANIKTGGSLLEFDLLKWFQGNWPLATGISLLVV